MKIGCIIQARLASTRLPNKVLMTVGDKSILNHVIDRCLRANTVNQVVLAVPGKDKFPKPSIPVWGGPEKDVLQRYADCAKHFGFDVVVRVTSDCPLVPPYEIDRCVRTLIEEEADYVTNRPAVPDGWDVEVMTIKVLEKAHNEAKREYEREHVTPYIKSDVTLHSIYLEAPKLSVDTMEELEEVRSYYEMERDFELAK